MSHLKKILYPGLTLLALVIVSLFSTTSYADCEYSVVSDWPGGFVAVIRVTNNTSSAVDSWQVSWQYSGGSSITNGWSAEFSGANPYKASGAPWNRHLAVGQTVEFGFQGVKGHGDAEVPVLAGSLCGVTVASSSFSVISSSSSSSSNVDEHCIEKCDWYNLGDLQPLCPPPGAPRWAWVVPCIERAACIEPSKIVTVCTSPSSSASSAASSLYSFSSENSSLSISRSSSSSSSSSSATAGRLDNPWVNATPYLNEDWSRFAASVPGGQKVANIPVGIWLESVEDVEQLEYQLQIAHEQGADLVPLVLYNLPLKHCDGYYYNSAANTSRIDFSEYRSRFIDPLVAMFSRAENASIRFVVVLEPTAVINMVTNLDAAECQEAFGPGGYMDGMTYALNQFAKLKNVYTYVDAGTASILGWSDNFVVATAWVKSLIENTEEGWASVTGFAINSEGYVPVVEPFLPDPNLRIGGQPVRSVDFYEWNSYLDELRFAIDWRQAMLDLGAPESIGMLIDTSRNGWGGENRPTTESVATVLTDYVRESRIDRRSSRYDWCNIKSGVGYRPQVHPFRGIDAFAWITPPGRSDGSALQSSFCIGLEDSFPNPLPNRTYSDAISHAPDRGEWFEEALRILLQNAYPPL